MDLGRSTCARNSPPCRAAAANKGNPHFRRKANIDSFPAEINIAPDFRPARFPRNSVASPQCDGGGKEDMNFKIKTSHFFSCAQGRRESLQFSTDQYKNYAFDAAEEEEGNINTIPVGRSFVVFSAAQISNSHHKIAARAFLPPFALLT